MQQTPVVTVYAFRSYGCMTESPELSCFKATLGAIRAMGGEPLPATAEDVADDLLDERGCYRRVATGWGALD